MYIYVSLFARRGCAHMWCNNVIVETNANDVRVCYCESYKRPFHEHNMAKIPIECLMKYLRINFIIAA